MIGRTLDRYRIDAKLGEGGMGVVYKATDTQLGRTVAIKVLPHDKVSDPVRKRRFVLEAQAVSALNHPNIVTLYDVRSDAGTDFIVMEHVVGKTLDQIIPPKGLRLSRALAYSVAMADALATAHQAGIIHRDLKPSNVIVTDEGQVKILDFGLAKLVDPSDDSVETKTRAPMTEAGAVMGTAAYMSPEQAEGRRVDARTDIFSFGTVLYEMVTGQRPFAADSSLALLAKILKDNPAPPSQLNDALPADVEKTILRCLRKDPARRYQTMADLKVALEDLLADSASGSAPSVAQMPRRSPWTGRGPWAAIALLTIIAGYFAWQSLHLTGTAPLRAVPLSALPGVTRSPSFSPDGNQVAFSWKPASGNAHVWVQQVGPGTPLQLTTGDRDDYAPLWSPDGRWIAFLRPTDKGNRHELRLVAPLGGTERKVTDIEVTERIGRPLSLAWCPDSSCVITTDATSNGASEVLFAVSLDSGERRQLTQGGPAILADTDPAVSGDGKWLVFRRDSAPYNGGLMVLALGKNLTGSDEPRPLTDPTLNAYAPRFLPNNTEIIFSGGGVLWRLRMSGDGRPERLPFVGEDGLHPIVSRPQSDHPLRLAYVRSYTDVNIWRIDTPDPGVPATSQPVLEISSNRSDTSGQFGPDGGSLAFMSTRSGSGNEVWRTTLGGASAIQVSFIEANAGFPRWSHSGREIAFHGNPNANSEIFVVPADGGAARNLTNHPAVDTFPAYSSDDQWIYFTSNRSEESRVWKMPAKGGTAVPVSAGRGLNPIESPDGAYVYYGDASGLNVPGGLWQLPTKGGPAVKLLDGVFATAYDVLNSGIYYIQREGGDGTLHYFDLVTRRSTLIAGQLGDVSAFGIGVSPDGRTILVARTDASRNDLMLVENFR